MLSERSQIAYCRLPVRHHLTSFQRLRPRQSEPIPPILNNARLQWVTLYLGRAPYQGILTLSQQRAAGEAEMGTDVDVNLYKVREMDPNPLLQRLIDAYDANFPEEVFPDGGAEV